MSPRRIALAAMLLGAMSIGNATGWNPALAAGVPVGKLVIGAAFHARVFGGVDPAHHGLYQPHKKFVGEIPWPKLKADSIDE